MKFRFRVGQEIVCTDMVNTDPFTVRCISIAKRIGLVVPVAGAIYTVRELVEAEPIGHHSLHGRNSLLLKEIVNPSLWTLPNGLRSHEICFPEVLFAPIERGSKEVEELMRLSDPSKWTQDDFDRFDPPKIITPSKKEKAA